jgi:hypothetical protein
VDTEFRGRPIEIRYRADLLDTAGQPAHAATFIRQRLIVLDAELKGNAGEHERILLHELFHFVWVRLGNPPRLAWEDQLRGELAAKARGEAGWSAEWRKRDLSATDVAKRSRRWREYCCEGFCDTGALFAGAASRECTLARKRLNKRIEWFGRVFHDSPLPI